MSSYCLAVDPRGDGEEGETKGAEQTSGQKVPHEEEMSADHSRQCKCSLGTQLSVGMKSTELSVCVCVCVCVCVLSLIHISEPTRPP